MTNFSNNVSIFAITPTYNRLTQKVDLTSLCYTIENVPNFIWIVVEDSDHKSSLVRSLLTRCKVSVLYVYCNRKLHVQLVGVNVCVVYIYIYIYIYIYKRRCLSVYMFVPSFRPNQSVDFSETWHDDRF